MSNLYRFGQFVLDPGRRTLSRADSPVSLTPKAFDVLLFLVQNSNRLVSKEELLQAVWGNTFVEEGTLTQYISHLRKALGDNSEATVLASVKNESSDPVFDDALDTALRYEMEQTPYLNILGLDKVFGTLAQLNLPT